MYANDLQWTDSQWVRLPGLYPTRGEAEWARGLWKGEHDCRGDPFRTVEVRPALPELGSCEFCPADGGGCMVCGPLKPMSQEEIERCENHQSDLDAEAASKSSGCEVCDHHGPNALVMPF